MGAAHRKDVSSLVRNRKDSGNLKDKEIREKLVLKLKRKAESNVSSQAGRVNKVKTGGGGLESVSDDGLSDALEDISEDEEMEDASEDEIDEDSSAGSNQSDNDSNEELRLTSTDEEKDKGK